MILEAQTPSTAKTLKTSRFDWLAWMLCICALFALLATTSAAPKLSADNALGFFTNAASAIFKQANFRDFNNHLISVANIPIYPLNQYTPAVHRLLQVTANIYECTTTNLYPCIYRPMFSAQGTNIFISSYELVNGPDNVPTSITFLGIPGDINNSATRAAITFNTRTNIYGVPWVIGAKKGFPNLNQIAMASVSQMTRKLLVTRPYTRNDWNDYHGKQVFILGVSNSLAVEIWNSYNTTFPRPLYIQADCKMTVQLTNDAGYTPAPITFNLGGALAGATNLTAGTLINTGLQPPVTLPSKQPNKFSFVVPLLTNLIVLPDSVQIGGVMVVANDSTALWNSIPWDNLIDSHWGLNIANNLRCIVMDGGLGGRVVDYVQLRYLDTARDLTQEAISEANKLDVWTTTPIYTAFWATTSVPIPQGVVQQLLISIGSKTTSATDWSDNGLPAGNRNVLIAAFLNFMVSSTVSSNAMQAPFTPTAKIYQLTKWQANDPLVHYMTEDLAGIPSNNIVLPPNSSTIPKVTNSMYRLNERFSPWGGFGPQTGWLDFLTDPHLFDTALKDPLVMVSDNWNFPSNQPLNFSWLGQVHRGTPWQTVHLKSANILSTDLMGWKTWSGSANDYIATNLAPVNDWRLASLLNSLFNTNDQRQLLSVNNADTNAWLHTLDGFTVLTNSPVQLTLGPFIVSSNSPAAAFVVNALSQTRTAQPGHLFKNVSDILGIPELSDASPFLDTNSLAEITAGGLTDEAFEKLPNQLLPLLRLDSIGSLISTNGQLLVQFTGDDNFSYAIQVSSNLLDWVGISTNTPSDGIFIFPDSAPLNTGPRFYRSVLLP